MECTVQLAADKWRTSSTNRCSTCMTGWCILQMQCQDMGRARSEPEASTVALVLEQKLWGTLCSKDGADWSHSLGSRATKPQLVIRGKRSGWLSRHNELTQALIINPRPHLGECPLTIFLWLHATVVYDGSLIFALLFSTFVNSVCVWQPYRTFSC